MKTTSFLRPVLFGLLAALTLAFTGCTSPPTAVRVQPWERATLAEYSLRPDRDTLATALGEHTYFSRESVAGGRGVGGSGCGCN